MRNIRFISLIILFLGIAGLLVFQATRESSAAVLVPSDLQSADKTLLRIRVGGRVAPDAIEYRTDPDLLLQFKIHNRPEEKEDASAFPRIPVVYKGLKPDMFAAGRDVIIDGEFKDGVLHAYKLLTQCPSKYEPPSPTHKQQ